MSTRGSSDEGEPQPLEHKLAAIRYADVAGYSRLTGEDEEGTHRILSAYLDAFAGTIQAHRGTVKHYALKRLAKEVLPNYEPDDVELSSAQLKAIKRLEPQGRVRSVKSSLF